MNTYKNKEIKKYLIIYCIVSCALLIIGGLIVNGLNKKYLKNENEKIAELLTIVSENYPDADMESLITALNSPALTSSKKGIEYLHNHGIMDKDYSIASCEKIATRNLILTLLVIFAIELIFFILAVLYIRKRHQRVNELTSYIEQISHGNYSLDLEENSEDELSNLKNELYKISLAEKENALNAKKNRAALADSVSDISHQLKTPLTSISVLLDNLLDAEDMDATTRQTFLKEISRQLYSINWLTVTLLKLSRLDAGVVEFETEDISLSSLFKEVDNNLDILAELKNISMDWKLDEDIFIKGDYNWNREAISNIVKNALEHSPEDSKVTIKATDNDVYTKITVSDNGPGISPEDQKHIFDRFYRSSTALPDSNGIGLPLAKAIIEKQNGYLSLESSPAGTTFTIKYLKYNI